MTLFKLLLQLFVMGLERILYFFITVVYYCCFISHFIAYEINEINSSVVFAWWDDADDGPTDEPSAGSIMYH